MNQNYWERMLNRKLPRRRLLEASGAGALGAFLLACSGDDQTSRSSGADSGAARTSGSPTTGGEASHARGADPNSDLVFPDDKVNEMTIVVTAARWQEMLDNMTSLFGARGSGGGFGGPQGPGQAPEGVMPGQAPEGMPGQGPGGGAGGPGGPGGGFSSENPMWVPATIQFNGLQWHNVGLRFKGNSTLRSSWGSGSDKMPFKLDFDQFEDEYSEVRDQRFYGFKQLSLSNNTGDSTYMREALAYDLLEEAGLVAAKTGFYELFLDRGEGRSSLGIYTVIEVIDDTVVERHFEDASGNLYEADGRAASLAAGVENRIQTSFQVESDEAQADWSDIRRLYTVLHSSERTTNPTAWRQSLESIFEVDAFLEWLAMSAVLQHWDTYGGMTHNYYLYNNPENGRLSWISWDHNFILGASMGGGGRNNAAPNAGMPGANNQGMADGFGRANTSFDKTGVGDNWPLISFLIAQPEYKATYDLALKETIEGTFEPLKVAARIRQLGEILAPYAAKSGSEAAYRSAVESLATMPAQRAQAARTYLESA